MGLVHKASNVQSVRETLQKHQRHTQSRTQNTELNGVGMQVISDTHGGEQSGMRTDRRRSEWQRPRMRAWLPSDG